MAKIIRLTESDLTRLVKRVIEESKNKKQINEGFWDSAWEVLKGAAGGIAGSSIFNYFTQGTGKQVLKTMLDMSPAGVLSNMAKSASNGDANGFKQALMQASKQTGKDFTAIQTMAFKDLKWFGDLLKKSGL